MIALHLFADCPVHKAVDAFAHRSRMGLYNILLPFLDHNAKAVVGFRILRETGSPDVLECTIYDYEPTDFLNGVYEMYKDYGSDPIMLEAPLRLQFVRVK